jgi:hypothetical protein
MARWIKNTPIPPVKRAEIEPPSIFRKLYRPLGAIAVTFADLEAQVTHTLNALLGTSRREGNALESLMQSFSLRIELFYFLALRATQQIFTRPGQGILNSEIRTNEELRKSAEAIYGSLKQANSDRNNLLHGAWTGLSPEDLTYSKTRLKTGDGKLTEIPLHGISIQLLKEEADFIISVNMRLADWTARIRRIDRPDLWPPPLLDKYLLHSPLHSLIRENKKRARAPQP